MTIQETLRSHYQRDQWQKILEEVFNKSAQRLSLISPTPLAAAHDSVKQTLQLGNIELDDGNTIAVLEIETTDQITLARNRVGLRHFVTSFIDQADATAVLAVFYQKDSDDWRLTYASRTTTLDEDTFEVVNIETAPKRFTYLLGNDEPCRTPAARLAKIRDNKDEIDLKTIELAFSVESLSKDFFKKYKEHYEKFTEYLLSPDLADSTRANFEIEIKANEAAQEKEDKPVRDFVKTLLGRLVFLHFLQKKRWLSCSKGSRQWTDGDAQFLENYKQMAVDAEEEDLFHSKYLCPLFFEALNQEDRNNDLFELTHTRMPYLNGGLFEEDADEHRDIDFPIHYFTELLDFFGEYNFTIDENDPEDHEVGIDPEMLGMIFENLLEDNKEKGTYYTPKAIVSYMSRQSLLHYLQTHLGENDELEKLLQEKDYSNHTADDNFVNQHRKKIIQLLHDVTVCDPAIGSGAFPIGMLHEILWTMLTLMPDDQNTSENRATLKRQIIQNSIHGVDIDPGAIEIARLRFWLALVVDEDAPRPLPNLDYKIHRADSLIEYIRGEAVNLGTDTPTDATTKQAVNELIAAKKSLFTAQRRQEKRDAWFALYRSLSSLAQAEFTWLRSDTNFADGDRLNMLTNGIKDFGHWITQIDSVKKAKVHLQDTLLDKLRHWFDDPKKPTFLWNLHFGGAMAEGGFDIVIANPPYVRHELIKAIKPELKKRYKCFVGTADLLVYFYEQATNILKDNGVITFITSNKYYRAGYGKKLRAFLNSNLEMQTLIDFRDAPVFNNVIAYASILIGRKSIAENDHSISCLPWDLTQPISSFNSEICKLFPIDQTDLSIDGWRMVVPSVNNLLKKLKAQGTPLGQHVKSRFYRGILTGLNDAYVIDSEKRAELIRKDPNCEKIIKPFLGGRDIKRWSVNHENLYFIKIESSSNTSHLWSGLKAEYAWEKFKELYPSIAQHFTELESVFDNKGNCLWDRLLSRDDQGFYFWELRSCGYWEEFNSNKIIWGNLATKPQFAIDNSQACISAPANLIVTDETWLLAFLNSKLIQYQILWAGAERQNGYFEFKPMYITPLTVPSADDSIKSKLTKLCDSCAVATSSRDTTALASYEHEIDHIVYRLFDLNPEEIDLIETTLAK